MCHSFMRSFPESLVTLFLYLARLELGGLELEQSMVRTESDSPLCPQYPIALLALYRLLTGFGGIVGP